MNNEDKILKLLETLVEKVDNLEQGQAQTNARLDKVDGRLDKVDGRLDTIEEKIDVMQDDIEILKEDAAITREICNTFLEWAEIVDKATLQEVIRARAAKAE